MAQTVRLVVAVAAMAIAVWIWLTLSPARLATIAAIGVFLIGGGLAKIIFRRLASAETVRADLQDRVRNPPP
jgi:uncharacterized membrane protein HdeD (DUF308 family)